MGYLDNAIKIRGKCNLARQIFQYAALAPEYSRNQGFPWGINTNGSIFSELLNPKEYDINTVYVTSDSQGAWPVLLYPPEGISVLKGIPPIFYQPTNTTLYDISGATLFRGFLQVMTLEQYCINRNFRQTATRVFTEAFPKQTADYTAQLTAICNADKTVINEYDTYYNWLVPVITWYYTNANGERVSDRQSLSFMYFHTANQTRTSRWEQVQIPFGGGTEYQQVKETYSFGTASYGISAPYVSSLGSVYSGGQGVPLNGYVYCTKSGDGVKTTVTQNPNPIYTLVSVGYNPGNIYSDSDYYPITDGDFAGKLCADYAYAFSDNEFIPLFKTVDEIINFYSDFGVPVSTDIEDALSPQPTPEEEATPNPDSPNTPIENFPDNTTETTPIESAYITPSTFAQARVYTPTTIRDFLKWVCNSTVNIDNWARLFANPVDVITGINLYNLDIPAHDNSRVRYDTITDILGVTTEIPNYAILDGYNNIVDGGTLRLTAYYGNYADFTSMTYQAFIPFVGFVSLRACDVVNKTLHLYYAVDFATGAAVAFLNSDDKLIYTSPCTVAGKIPISTSDKNSQMINNTLSVIGGIGGLLGGIASGNVGGGVGSFLGNMGGLQFQTNYANKGSLSAVNMYKLLPAFVERTRYDLFLPSDDATYSSAKYQSYAGAPSTQFDTLLNCVDAGGFVQSDVVYLTSQTATETEKQQIIDLIKSGIYL